MFEYKGSYYKLKECQLIGNDEIYPYPIVTIDPERRLSKYRSRPSTSISIGTSYQITGVVL